jgi:hypothetical protein
VEAKDVDGCTAICVAAAEGQLAVVQWLVLEAKVDVEAKDKDGCTALMAAVFWKHVETSKWLAKSANADTRVKGKFGSAVDFAEWAEARAGPQEVRKARRLAQWLARPCGLPGCEARGQKECGRCKRVHYCSRVCQAAHWPAHKQECDKIENPLGAPPSTNNGPKV